MSLHHATNEKKTIKTWTSRWKKWTVNYFRGSSICGTEFFIIVRGVSSKKYSNGLCNQHRPFPSTRQHMVFRGFSSNQPLLCQGYPAVGWCASSRYLNLGRNPQQLKCPAWPLVEKMGMVCCVEKVGCFQQNACDVCPSVYRWSSPIHCLSFRYFFQFSLHGKSVLSLSWQKKVFEVWSTYFMTPFRNNLNIWCSELRTCGKERHVMAFECEVTSYEIWRFNALKPAFSVSVCVCQMWALSSNILYRWMQKWVADLNFDGLKFGSTVAILWYSLVEATTTWTAGPRWRTW